MAINLQKTLDNIKKKQGTYVPSAGKGDKIDLNKTLENIRAKSAAELEQRRVQRAEETAIRNRNTANAMEQAMYLQQRQNPQAFVPTPQSVSTQRQQTASYPRLSIGERVGQTLAGLQEGSYSTTPSAKVLGGNLTANANNADQYGRGVIQSKIDELRQMGQRTDKNGLGYFDTPAGERELNAGLRELETALRTLTGEDVKINGLAAAQDVLDSLPTINWGRWAQVDPNAGAAMQAIEDRKDTEARSDYQDYYNEYLHLMEREDFAEKSRYKSTATGEAYEPGMAMYGTSGYGDLLYDYINKNRMAVERKQLMDTTAGFSALGIDDSFLQTMTGDEVKIYNYLYSTEGRERANEYLQYLQSSLTARQRQETQEWFRNYARENPVKASALSALMAPARGLSYLGQTADLLQDGSIDQNAAYNKFSDVPTTIRETVAENWGSVGSFAYQTGMSMADFLITLGISGGSSALSTAIMGSGAAADTVIDAKDRGLSDVQAFTLGTIAGAAEAMTERVSIESLLDMTTLGKSAVGYIVKNALSEAGEEAASGIVNTLTDIIVSRDKSQWQQEIDRYFAQGMTRKQAVNLALMNQAKSIGLDALGGALSGGIMGGGMAGLNAANNAVTNRVNAVEQQYAPMVAGMQLNSAWQNAMEEQEAQQAQPQEEVAQEENEPVQSDAQAAPQMQTEAVQAAAQEVDIIPTANEQAQTGVEKAQEAPMTLEGGELYGREEGNVLPDDRPQRQFDTRAGEQTGGVERSTVEPESYANQSAVAAARQNRLRNIEASRTDPGWLNLDGKTYDTRQTKVFPNDLWDSQMEAVAQRAFEKGVDVQFFTGTLRAHGKRVDGVNLGDGRIMIQADSLQWSVEQLADHEMMHTYLADEYGLRDEILRKMNDMDTERLNQMVASYIVQYNGVIDPEGAMTDEELNDYARAYVIDEIICDAYAGMNRRGWGATKFSETVRASYDNRISGRDVAMDQDVRGPPRYSVETLEDGRKYVRADRQVIFGNDPEAWGEQVEDYINGKIRRGEDVQLTTEDGDVLTLTADTAGKAKHRYNPDGSRMSDALYETKLNAETHIDELAGISRRGKTVPDYDERHGEFAKDGWNYRTAFFMDFDGAYYEVTLSVAQGANGNVIYNVGNIHRRSVPTINGSSAGRGAQGGNASSEHSVPQGATVVKAKFSVSDEVDSEGNELSVEQAEYFKDSKVRDENGDLMVMYHGTVSDFTIFDRSFANPEGDMGAGFYFTNNPDDVEENYASEEGPDLKIKIERLAERLEYEEDFDSYEEAEEEARRRLITAEPHALKVYLNITRPVVIGGEDATVFDMYEEYDEETDEYGEPEGLLADFIQALNDELEWGDYSENTADTSALWENGYDGLDAAELVRLVKEEVLPYIEDSDGNLVSSEVVRATFERMGFDGIIDHTVSEKFSTMAGMYSDTTHCIVFDSNQAKNVDNRTPTSDPDIRYSVADEDADDDVQMLETAESTEAAEPERKQKRDAVQARKELRSDLMNLFSVPAGVRGEAGRRIDDYAQQIIERGSLNNYDRDVLFDVLHNYGEMEIPANEYMRALRGAVKGAKIYVPEEVKTEFGGKEEWNEFRREAFAAGVIFTNNQNDPTADVWNQELADLFPGAFDEYESDAAWILRGIVNVAQQGKSEKMTLAEYATSLAEQYGPQVIDDYYANMERQMDQLLNNFADKARFENKLRERTEGQLRRDAEYRREKLQQQRQNRQVKELQQKTLKQLQWLSKNRHKTPADLRKRFEEVLGDIDIFAASAANEMNYSNKYNATWRDLKDMYLEAKQNDPNWLPSKDLERIVSRLSDPKLEDFNYNELNDLYRAALGLRQELYNRRNLLIDNRMFEEVYDSSMQEISEAAAGYKGTWRDHLLNLQQLTPMNVIERMAGWNPNSAWLSMGKQLEQGERDTKKFAIESQKMLQKFIEDNADWIKTADGQGKNAVWYEYELPELTGFRRGDAPVFSDKRIKVYMTPAMKIQLYLESKSYDNLNHMLGGRTFADKDMYTEAAGDSQKRREAMAKGQIVRLTPEMVRDMVKDLTPQELELANILGNGYYNGYAKQEINRVSNVLYGYDKAMSGWYTPIFTDDSFTKSEPGVFDATAEGAGNLKERVQMSTNPSLNLSAFDAFDRSVSQTSKFVGMAIPVRNWNTLMNWRDKENSMKKTIKKQWGDEMLQYLSGERTGLIARLQNPDVKDKTVIDEIVGGALSNYISAVFGLNPSVVAKQFGSYFMAFPYLGINNIPTPKQIHATDPKLIAKYSPELDDRLLGYAIPEVSQLKEKPNWSQKNKVVEFVAGGGAITAMDGWVAKTLWPWAENKVARETGLKRGTDEFYRRVAVEFDNAVVRSQSINDIMHRSTLMNSQSAVTRAFTMFKTDSAQSYNMLREAFGEAQYMKENGTEEQKKAANKKAAYAVLGVAANNLWAAAITALVSLWKNKGKNYRDDEGELTAASAAAQYSEDVLTSMAGVVIGGEEIADVIASLLGGDKWYGIELAGGEQLSDMVDEIVAAGTGIKEILTDGYYILNNDGDLGEYLEDRSADLIGAAKEMAQKIVKYIAGVPVDNLEAYLVGTLRWAAPQAVAAYEDALKSPDTAGLKGLEGKALETRMDNVLRDRMGGATDETVTELSRLYGAVETSVIPPEDADSIGDLKLTTDQKQVYRMSVSETVGRYLDEFVASERYAEMDDEAKAKRLNTLYKYAKEIAKAAVTGEEPETNVQRINDLLDNGMEISEALAAYDEYERSAKLLQAGLDPEMTADLAAGIRQAEDANGKDVDLSNLEKYELVLEYIGDEAMRYASLAGMMDEKELARFTSGYDWVSSETYIKFLRAFKDKYPEESKSQERVEIVLKSMDLDRSERAALWQMSGKNWKAENNPFDWRIGEEIFDAIEAAYKEIDGE